MKDIEHELTPVIYNQAAVSLKNFILPEVGKSCFRMHWHNRLELLRIRTGEIRIDFGTVQAEYGPDTLVIIPPDHPHQGVCSKAPLNYDAIMFDVRSFYNQTDICRQYLLPILEGKTKFLHATQQSDILDCADHILTSSDTDLDALLMTSEIYKLIYLLYRDCVVEIHALSSFDRVIEDVLEYVRENYATDMTAASLSAKFRYAEPYFCRKFKEHTGLTLTNYINIFRLETAYWMLRSEHKSIGDIAEACGFTDANYFSRCFKKHFGHSPRYYRAEHAKECSD